MSQSAAARLYRLAIVTVAILTTASLASVGRAAPPIRRTNSTDIHKIVGYMLNASAISATTQTFVRDTVIKASGGSSEALEVERMYPGFHDQVQSRVNQEVSKIVARRLPSLRQQYESLLAAQLSYEDIREVLRFQCDPVSRQLRAPAFVETLKGANPNGGGLARQMQVQMTAHQRAFSLHFLQSPAGTKFVALAPRLEKFKDQWVQDVLNDVAKRMPKIGDIVLQQYDSSMQKTNHH